jgi:hypothetical protein
VSPIATEQQSGPHFLLHHRTIDFSKKIVFPKKKKCRDKDSQGRYFATAPTKVNSLAFPHLQTSRLIVLDKNRSFLSLFSSMEDFGSKNGLWITRA